MRQALPIDEALPALMATLRSRPNAVLVAPPGAGKTTRVPLALLEEPWVQGRKLLLLEPRRLAARAAAARMAGSLGEEIGGTIGLRIRLDTKVGPATRLEILTEGVFTRMILDDPELNGVAGVLFDEFHERSLDADLGLALALDAQSALREDLRLLVMSATLDSARAAQLLGNAPVVESLGRAHPVETIYIGRDPRKRIEDQVVDTILKALRADLGSILVFLPGAGEIRRVETQLRERIGAFSSEGGTGSREEKATKQKSTDSRVEIAPLYGTLDRAAQDRAIAPTEYRKIVLATSIAETSLTIEGVRIVVDSGLARIPVFEPEIGLTRLETRRVSRAGADQRRGRAGRTEPGLCYRLWEESANGALEPHSPPEILCADLAPFLLDCAAWGVTDPASLPFLDPPPRPAVNEARALLRELGALDSAGALTEEGKRLRSLPLPPRLSRMVLRAGERGQALDAAELAALLVERGLGGDGTDLRERLARFRADRSAKAQEMRKLARSWAAQAKGASAVPGEDSLGGLLALAYPDRVAKARGNPGEFLLANGRGAMLEPHDPLSREPFLAVADIAGSAAQGRIVAAAPLALEEIETLFADRLVSEETTVFDLPSRALRTRRVKRLNAVILSERPIATPPNEEAARILLEALIRHEELPWTPSLLQWRDRVGFMARIESGQWPDDILRAGDGLASRLVGKTKVSELTEDDFADALKTMLPWEHQKQLDLKAPSHFEAPTGSRVAIDYTAPEPVLAIRVQELFGLETHPSIAGIPLVLHLLSPARRPIQITKDLPGFWRGSWAAVKAEMKGRYPRHPWPDDPAQALPTRRAKPRT